MSTPLFSYNRIKRENVEWNIITIPSTGYRFLRVSTRMTASSRQYHRDYAIEHGWSIDGIVTHFCNIFYDAGIFPADRWET